MENVSGSMHNLIVSSHKEIKCIESIVFSSFNPPPSYRRLVGDLVYLDVVTLEGNKFCITVTSKHFYVNSSTGDMLDPLPSKAGHEANTLVELLQKIISKFKKGFREILERKAAAHPFENVQPPLSQNSWLDVYPIPDHKRDAAREEDSLTISFGSELIGMQRVWNEELQSCQDFPHSVPQERILRDRALYKVTCDFVEAATNGAIGVINRCIPPINPTDPECFHMEEHVSGVVATVERSLVTVGTLNWLLRNGVVHKPLPETELNYQSIIYIGIDGDLAGLIYFEDKIREDAREVVDSLSKQGISMYMISGDKKSTAEYVASIVGIPKDKVLSEFKPEEKKNLSASFRKIKMWSIWLVMESMMLPHWPHQMWESRSVKVLVQLVMHLPLFSWETNFHRPNTMASSSAQFYATSRTMGMYELVQ